MIKVVKQKVVFSSSCLVLLHNLDSTKEPDLSAVLTPKKPEGEGCLTMNMATRACLASLSSLPSVGQNFQLYFVSFFDNGLGTNVRASVTHLLYEGKTL